MSRKIKKGEIKRTNTSIPALTPIQLNLVCFSFKYLEIEHEKFDLPDTSVKISYLYTILDRLKQISSMHCNEFRLSGKALRSHIIKWENTTEPDGYCHLSEQMQECSPWQFSLSREELGRIHGFILGDIFYVVWIDHDHKLYP